MKRIAIILIAALFVGCAIPTGTATVNFTDLTPKQKVTWAMGVYNAAYSDYQFQSSFEDLTDVERQLLREKKKVLAELYTAISLYDSIVVSSGDGDAETEKALIVTINRLERLVVRRIE